MRDLGRRAAALIVVSALLGSAAVAVASDAAAAASAAGGYRAVTPARVKSVRLAAHHGIAIAVGGHAGVPRSGVAAVAISLSALSPARTGSLVAWRSGRSRPGVTSLRFTAGQNATTGTVVPVSSSGRLDVYNASSGAVTVVVDAAGYYPSGSASGAGAFHAVTPARVVDTTKGTAGTRKGALAGGHSFSAAVGGHAAVPKSGVAAVALTVTVTAGNRSGSLYVYGSGSARPRDALVHYRAGRTASAFTIARVSSSGRIALANIASGSSVQIAVDVDGYVTAGVTTLAGRTLPTSPTRLSSASLAAHHTASVQVGGKAGVSLRGVTAAVVLLTASSATRAGGLIAYRSGATRPRVHSLAFAAGQTSSTGALVAVSSTGRIAIYNSAARAVHVTVDVLAFVRATTIVAPATSVGRYVRDLSESATDADNAAVMNAHGCADAQAGAGFVLLDIGAQRNDKQHVLLTATTIQLTYAQLLAALGGYVDGFRSCSSKAVTIAVATNNDGDFDLYKATPRGSDWASRVVRPLVQYVTTQGYTGVTIAGANDIEPDGSSTQAEAQQWESGYLDYLAGQGDTTSKLIFIGSADGCPTTFGSTAACNHGWTQSQLYKLAHGIAPGRIQAMPQIYTVGQAAQWANIARTGGSATGFVGALTEFAACPKVTGGCSVASLRPADGWAAFRTALSGVATSPSLPRVTDLRIDA